MASTNTLESPLEDDDDDDDDDDDGDDDDNDGRINHAATSSCLGCIDGSTASATDSNVRTLARTLQMPPPSDTPPPHDGLA